MRAISLLLLLICLTPLSTKAQKFEFNGEFLLFREAKTKQPVLIINDSLAYKGLAMKKIAFKHTEYPAKLQEYKFFNIGTKTYLVHDGCGPVLEYRNDSIVRIDNSFLHRNQFGAARFVYNNEIYFFGGYGLFTTKNILTKFEFNTGEWIEVQTSGSNKIESRSAAFNYIRGNNFYVFGGTTKDVENIPEKKLIENYVWRLYLPKMTWYCEGKFNPILQSINPVNNIVSNKKLLFISTTYFEINERENKINKFEQKYFPNIQNSYLEGNKIVGVFQNNYEKYFDIVNIRNIRGKLKETSFFVKPLNQNNWLKIILTIISLISTLFLLIFYRKKIKNILFPYNGIFYIEKKGCFMHKRKVIFFEEHEKIILFYLIDRLNQFVSLNELNQLFEKNNQSETISATVKRREQAVSGLLTKVSKITGIEDKKLILERKNSEDKRIKDILLLPNLLKKEIK
jgi:CRISPR/Cas system-associated endoribonuclease Cas2